jgi:glycerol-3-phosphate dehydrogenase
MTVDCGDVAVIGGGINGICIAWEFVRHGRRVELFEANTLMSQTSSASSKLLHGGLRYLEYGRIFSVREALLERAWWLQHAPELTNRIELLLPVYSDSSRSRYKIGAGLTLYDWLAGGRGVGRHRWLDAVEISRTFPELRSENVVGGFVFYDGQMNDRLLGLWAAQQARNAGARIFENESVDRVSVKGNIWIRKGAPRHYERIVNAAGPWAGQLLARSGIDTGYRLDAIRGSHLLVSGELTSGYCLQHPEDSRIFFVLPYQGRVLIGTTEVEQNIEELIEPAGDEIRYLLRGFNCYFKRTLSARDIFEVFAGIRPIVHSRADPTSSSREYIIEKKGKLITVWGGKWTTSRALARKVYASCTRGDS